MCMLFMAKQLKLARLSNFTGREDVIFRFKVSIQAEHCQLKSCWIYDYRKASDMGKKSKGAPQPHAFL